MNAFPAWAQQVVAEYESRATGAFILYGNVADRMLVPEGREKAALGRLQDFLLEALLPRFDVVLSYDVGQGIVLERGGETFAEWPSLKKLGESLPRQPLPAVRVLSHYLAYCRNLKAVGADAPRVAVIFRQADLVCPALPNSLNYDLNALASLLRSWAVDVQLQDFGQAVFLVTGQLNALHPLVTQSPRVGKVEIPVPGRTEMSQALNVLVEDYSVALDGFRGDLSIPAERLAGASLSSVENLLKRRSYEKSPLKADDLAELKKRLVEQDCNGLIEFVEPSRDLDDVFGFDEVKAWLRQDIQLWNQGELKALPMGYLFCGPVGTGKTYLAECLAGEAGVPVVIMRNFRDRWVGSTEANLERIFALLHALGRCIVFVDEADQSLGSRQGGSGDSGVSSRVYSMMAQEMSDTDNRGKILWVLASSRPDMIEVDLKRPGRIDVKIPLFPTTTAREGFALIRALCRKQGVVIEKETFDELEEMIPDLLTPGSAEAVSVKAYRLMATQDLDALEAVRACLADYLPAVSEEVLKFQMKLAADEATERSFVPERVEELLSSA